MEPLKILIGIIAVVVVFIVIYRLVTRPEKPIRDLNESFDEAKRKTPPE